MAKKSKKIPRENARVPRKNWTSWKKAMVPDKPKGTRRTRRRRGHVGFYCNYIKKAFDHLDCGIYEFKAVHREAKNYVVYIGSTYRKTRNDLETRIMEYCRDGSHMRAVINKVLKNGYELHVRAKGVRGLRGKKRRAEDAENEMLRKYDYAWNTRKNSPSRKKTIPPCPPSN